MKAHPDDAGFVLTLAKDNLSVGNYQEASRQFENLLAKQPNNPLILNNLAWTLGQMDDPRAMSYAEQALKLAPNEPSIIDTVAMLAAKKGDTQRAQSLLNEALGIAPNAYAIRLDLAKVLIQMGKKDEAVAELRQLEKLGDKFAGHAEVQKMLSAATQKP